MLRLVLSVFLTTALFLAVSVAAQPSPHSTPSPSPIQTAPALSPGTDPVDGLDAADLRRAIPLIQDHYVNPAAVNGAELESRHARWLAQSTWPRRHASARASRGHAHASAFLSRDHRRPHRIFAAGRFEPVPARGTGHDSARFRREECRCDRPRSARLRRDERLRSGGGIRESFCAEGQATLLVARTGGGRGARFFFQAGPALLRLQHRARSMDKRLARPKSWPASCAITTRRF